MDDPARRSICFIDDRRLSPLGLVGQTREGERGTPRPFPYPPKAPRVLFGHWSVHLTHVTFGSL